MNGFIFFLKSVFVFFPVSVSVRICVPPTWGKLLLLSVRQHWAEHHKTYAIVSKRTELRRLILTSGSTHVETKAVCERASAPKSQFIVGS